MCVAVACSGGRDSMALLLATVRAASPLGVGVVALHVNHGLSPNADAWQAHVAARCRRWAREGIDVRFACERLVGAPTAGESVEAWARTGRYAALGRLARLHGSTLVLLAHHRRDQAETVLLQALRGGGLAGLAAMPACSTRDGIVFARPWLERPPEAIARYARARRIRHVDDESNADTRYDRNRLRLEVWPALEAAFPQAECALAASALRLQEAHDALAEIASLDLQRVAPEGPLVVDSWSRLSPPRAANALRAWLRRSLGCTAGAALMARLQAELSASRAGRWVLREGTLQVHRGALHAVRGAAVATGAPREDALSIDAPGSYALPGWQGALEVAPAREGGVALEALRRIELLPRRGGERWQAGPGRPPRSLKKQFQMAGVPAWSRDAPLVYGGGRLLYVPGLGIDARVRAAPGDEQVVLHWRAHGAVDGSA